MQQRNKIAQSFSEISVIYFGEHWACAGTPDQTQQALHDLTKASMDIYLHAKNEHYTLNSF